MKSVPGGEADICQYYHIAPAIVDKINTLPDAKNIYDRIYTELVLPCVEFIQNGDNEAAYTQYRNYVEFLRMEYLKI